MRFIFIFLTVFIFYNASGQDVADTISMVRKSGGFKFYQHNKEIRFVELPKLMKDFPHAYDRIQVAKTNRTFSNVFLGIGSISLAYGILYGLAQSVEEDEPTFLASGTLAGIIVGGVFIGISFPLNKAYKKKTRHAIDLYNSALSR